MPLVDKPQDIKTLKEFKKQFDKKFRKQLNFSVYRKVNYRDWLGYGAETIYVTPIPKNFKETKWVKNPQEGKLWLESGINANGITGKHDIGRTYTIKFEQLCTERGFRRRSWNTGTINNFYGYGRTIEEILEKFQEFMDNKFVK